MLKKLTIDNFALINHLSVDLHDGLSIITGETGAGKSIIIGALSLLLGQRADSRSAKNRDAKTVVEAVFDIKDYDLKQFFETSEIEYFPEETIVRREILPSGRSRAFVNDTPVQLALMGELTQALIDIHSQHSNALLLKSAYQLSMLDDIADNGNLLGEYKSAYHQFVEQRKHYEEVKKRIEQNKADEEYFRFQLNQLESADLHSGEQEDLERDKAVLENMAQLKDSLSAVCNLLNDNSQSAIDSLSDACRSMSQISDVYENADGLIERMESAKIDLQDIYETVSHDFQNLDNESIDIDEVENRLSTIYTLQQKFHVDTIDALLAHQTELKKSIDEIDNSEDELAELQQQLKVVESRMVQLAEKLSSARKKAAERFLTQLKEKTAILGLKNFKGEIAFDTKECGNMGQDKVQLKVAFNLNQAPMPIETTASGGEISRLMLCVKTILAEKMQLPTIVFDEVDTGVSGEVANKIGLMMEEISSRIQVLTITHLPQVAALGRHHYKVYKEDAADETLTMLKELDAEARVMEIAGMLSGSTIDAAAIANAKSLIENKLR